MAKKIAPAPAVHAASLAAKAPAFVAHATLRLRGEQKASIDVYDARTPQARVSVTIGTVLMAFWSAAAVQGLLEAISAAKVTLIHLPKSLPALPYDPYGQPRICIDWTTRPGYAVVPQSRVTDDGAQTLRWTDINVKPVTIQVLDRVAYNSMVRILRDVHATAIAVCLDGPRHTADPTQACYAADLPTQ